MCWQVIIPAVVTLAATAATTATSVSTARKQASMQKRAMRQSDAQFKSMLKAQPTQDPSAAANAMVRNMSIRDAQKALVRSGGGTIQTSPLGPETAPYGKKTLLGE